MKRAYLDESGTGKIAKEPILVVAGVIVDTDIRLTNIRRYLSALIDEYVPESQRLGFAFHAVELFSGGKGFYERPIDPVLNEQARELRHSILERLCEIPKKFGLPILAGFSGRELVRHYYQEKTSEEQLAIAHGWAFSSCLQHLGGFVQKSCEPDEIADVVLEYTKSSQQTIKEIHAYVTRMSPFIVRPENIVFGQFIETTRIAEEVNFQKKGGSSLLQVADACAWVLRRKIADGDGVDRFFNLIKPCLLPSVAESFRRAYPCWGL